MRAREWLVVVVLVALCACLPAHASTEWSVLHASRGTAMHGFRVDPDVVLYSAGAVFVINATFPVPVTTGIVDAYFTYRGVRLPASSVSIFRYSAYRFHVHEDVHDEPILVSQIVGMPAFERARLAGVGGDVYPLASFHLHSCSRDELLRRGEPTLMCRIHGSNGTLALRAAGAIIDGVETVYKAAVLLSRAHTAARITPHVLAEAARRLGNERAVSREDLMPAYDELASVLLKFDMLLAARAIAAQQRWAPLPVAVVCETLTDCRAIMAVIRAMDAVSAEAVAPNATAVRLHSIRFCVTSRYEHDKIDAETRCENVLPQVAAVLAGIVYIGSRPYDARAVMPRVVEGGIVHVDCSAVLGRLQTSDENVRRTRVSECYRTLFSDDDFNFGLQWMTLHRDQHTATMLKVATPSAIEHDDATLNVRVFDAGGALHLHAVRPVRTARYDASLAVRYTTPARNVGIVMPCYMCADSIAEALGAAVLSAARWLVGGNDTQSTVRLIVVDDASPTPQESLVMSAWTQMVSNFQPDVVRALEGRLDITTLSLLTNVGPAAARNRGALYAKRMGCDTIVFADDDDVFDDVHVSKCVGALDAHPETGAAFTRARFPVDGIDENWIYSVANTIPGTHCVRVPCFMASGGFPEHGAYRKLGSGEDLVWSALLWSTCGKVYVNEYTMSYAKHGSGSFGRQLAKFRAKYNSEEADRLSRQDMHTVAHVWGDIENWLVSAWRRGARDAVAQGLYEARHGADAGLPALRADNDTSARSSVDVVDALLDAEPLFAEVEHESDAARRARGFFNSVRSERAHVPVAHLLTHSSIWDMRSRAEREADA